MTRLAQTLAKKPTNCLQSDNADPINMIEKLRSALHTYRSSPTWQNARSLLATVGHVRDLLILIGQRSWGSRL